MTDNKNIQIGNRVYNVTDELFNLLLKTKIQHGNFFFTQKANELMNQRPNEWTLVLQIDYIFFN